MKIKRLVRLGAATVLSLSSLLTFAVPMAHAATQTCEWVGGGSDLKFSTTANWASCGGSTPKAGDILLFDQVTTGGTKNLINDLGLVFGGVEAGEVTSSADYNIDTISLAAGAPLSTLVTADCNSSPVRISYDTVNAAGDLTVDTDGHNLSSANLTVAGNLTLENAGGTGVLSAATGSSVGGDIVIASPVQYTTDTSCSGGGIGGQPDGSSLTGFTVHGLTVQKDASVDLADSSFPITLGGGSGTTAPAINFYSNIDNGSGNHIATTYTVSGAITLLDDSQVYAGDAATVNFTGSISGTGKALTKAQTSTGTVTFNFSSNNTNTQNGTPQNPVQTVTISSGDSQAKDEVVVPNETLVLDGTRDFVSVLSGGVLEGSGTASAGLSVSAGGTVAPGHSPGCLTTSDLFLTGTYQAQIGGTTPCSGYDQIKVTGNTVNIDTTNSVLSTTLYNGFVPKVGQSYTIIDHAGSNPVSGNFSGVAEGGTYTNQGVTYTVTYKGGDGNDVVLTVKSIDASKLPKAPNTGMKLVAAHPLASLAVASAAALFMVYASRRLKPAPARARR